MSASLHTEQQIISGAALASGSTGDKATLAAPFRRGEILEAWVEWEGASTHATSAIVAFDKRPTAGSDTGRGSADVATVNKVASVNKQGKRTYSDLRSAPVAFNGGQEVVVEVTTANGEALAFKAGLVVREVPSIFQDNTALEATT